METKAQEEAERAAEVEFNQTRNFNELDFEPASPPAPILEEEPLPDGNMSETYMNNMLDGVEEGCDVEVRFMSYKIYTFVYVCTEKLLRTFYCVGKMIYTFQNTKVTLFNIFFDLFSCHIRCLSFCIHIT